jgi:hypothetical protein
LSSSRGPRLTVAALILVVLAGLSLRLLGLGYGLPATYNPDETPILNRALSLAKGDPSPHNFLYPSLYFYMLFAWEALAFVAGRVVGLYDSLAAFQRDYFVDPSRHFLAGRLLTALCGTLTIPALYWFGRRLYDSATGLAAAAFLCVSPIAVRDAHYVKLDVPTTMFTVLAHAALARLVVDREAAGRLRPWLIAGFLSGLAVSTQYYAIFVGFTMIAAALVSGQRTRNWRLTGQMFLWSVLAAAAGFFAGTPFLPFELQTALRDIAHVREVDIDRATAGGALFTATIPYLRMIFQDAAGWPVALAAVGGLVWAFMADWRRALVLVSFFVPFFLFIANTVPMSRYLNIVVPIVALWGAVGMIALWRALAPQRPAVAAALVVAAMVPATIESVRTDLFFRQDDTRTLAQRFIETKVAAGKTFLVQPYSAPIRRSRESLIESLRANLGDQSKASIRFQLTMALDPYPSPAYRLIYLGEGGLDTDKIYVLPGAFAQGDLAPLRALGVDYVILKQANVPNPAMAGLEAALQTEGRRIAEFTPYRSDVGPGRRAEVPPYLHNTSARIRPELERPGPTIEIWDVGLEAQRQHGFGPPHRLQ